MPLTGMFYSLFYGLPAFFVGYSARPGETRVEFYGGSFIDEINLKAQFLVLMGVGLLFIFWAGAKKSNLLQRVPQFSVSGVSRSQNIPFLTWGLAIGCLGYWVFPAVRGLPSVGQFLQPAGYVAFSVFYVLQCRGKLSRGHAIGYFFCLLPIWVSELLVSGLMTHAMYLAILWITLRLKFKGVLSWKLMLTALAFILIIYPGIKNYRNHYWSSAEQVSTTTKFLGLARSVISPNENIQEDLPRYKGFVHRISLVFSFSHVYEQTPDSVPYWKGETYRTLFTGWIPRFIWTSKPKESWGNVFGRRYGILDKGDESNSLNIPWITEMFANFGTLGVVLGMSLVGLFLGVLETVLNSPLARPLEQSIGAAVLLPLFYQESNFTVMTGSLLPLVICLWLYFVIGQRLPIPFVGADTAASTPDK